MKEKNSRDPVSEKHYSVLGLGVGAAHRKLFFNPELFVVICRCALHGDKLAPELVDLGILREESVSAKVHSVTLVNSGAGDSADIFALLKNYGFYICLFKELICRGKSCRACSDDYSCSF